MDLVSEDWPAGKLGISNLLESLAGNSNELRALTGAGGRLGQAEVTETIVETARSVDIRRWGAIQPQIDAGTIAAFINTAIAELSAANTALIAAGQAPQRTQVWLPNGTYPLEVPLVPAHYVGIAGESQRDTILVAPATDSAAIFKPGGASDLTRDVTFTDFTIEGRFQTHTAFTVGRKGISMSRTVGTRYSRITVRNTWATSIAFDFAVDCVGTDITVYNCGRGLSMRDTEWNWNTISGHSAFGMGTGVFPNESHRINGLTIVGTGFAGLFWEQQADQSLPYATTKGVKITNAYIVNANLGMLDAGSDGMFVDAKFYGCRRNAVHVDKTFLSVTGGKGGHVGGDIEATGNLLRTLTDVVTTNGSDTITANGGRFTNLDFGAWVDGPGIPVATVVTEIISQQKVRISKPATATASAVTATVGFGPRTKTDGATTSGSATVTSATGRFSKYFDTNRRVTGAGIPAGAYIASVTDATTIVLSTSATATATGVSIALGAYMDGGDIFIGEAGDHYSFNVKAHDAIGPHVNSKPTSKWGNGITFNDEVWGTSDTAYVIQGTSPSGGPIKRLTIAGSASDAAGDGVSIASDTDLLTVSARMVENTGAGLRTTGTHDMKRASLTGDVRGNTGGGFVNSHTISGDSRVDLIGGDTSNPSNLRVTGVGNGQVSLALTAPIPDADVTDYSWQYREGSVGAWTSFAHTAAPTPSITITGITNGSRYEFRAAKVTSGGTGTYTAGPVSGLPVAPILYADSFTRADSASTPGSTDGGTLAPAAWTVVGSGATFGIVSNSLRPTAGIGLCYIDPAKDHGTVEWVMPARSGGQIYRTLMIRGTDEANGVGVRVQSSNIQLVSRASGSFSSIVQYDRAMVAGDRIRIAWTTTQVKVWINGTLVITQASTQQNTATRIGMWGSYTNDTQTRMTGFWYSEQTNWPDTF